MFSFVKVTMAMMLLRSNKTLTEAGRLNPEIVSKVTQRINGRVKKIDFILVIYIKTPRRPIR